MAQLGWKDSYYCLFMSNMDCGVDTVVIKRRCPNKIATCAKIAHQLFEEKAEKDLSRPALTYLYNIEMN